MKTVSTITNKPQPDINFAGGRLLNFFFYSNYFYACCAIGLSIEAVLQQREPMNPWWYYTMIFIFTVLYYTYPYLRKSKTTFNPRTNWYTRNYKLMWWNQVIMTLAALTGAVWFFVTYKSTFFTADINSFLYLLIFPLAGLLYYGLDRITGAFNLRKQGWLKPFVIGFVWAGMVTIYPVLIARMMNGESYYPDFITAVLFVKNLMFVAVLCIIFDIKDYATDHAFQVRTFVVRIGLRKTIFYLLLPLTILGLVTFVYYGGTHGFSVGRIVLNVIPFLLLLTVVLSMRRRRPLLYYLVIIDGMLIVKAVCGIIAITVF